MLKSYYEILNLPSDATKSQIKNQYKKLVKMYHPDVNSSLEAEKIFKDINKAATILLDDEKRKNYDALRAVNKNHSQDKKENKQDEKASKYTFSDLFQTKKQTTKKENKKTPKNGDDIEVSVTIDYAEALLGTHRTVNITHNEICPKCLGHKFSNGQKCSFCNGLGEKTQNRKITVKIPPNLKNGSKLRIKEEGHKGLDGGKNGNLYVIVNIQQHEELQIKDGIVYYEAQISPYTAVLGGNITVPTLWGEAAIKIPPLTKTGQSFKLINVGVLNKKTNKKGEQIVRIALQIPTSITDEEYRLYEKLQEINSKKKNARFI